jgi:hypothetical protein
MEPLLANSSAILTIVGALLGGIFWVMSLNFVTKQNRADITELKHQTSGDISELRREFKEETDEIRGDIKSLREEVTNIRIEVARQGERFESKMDMILNHIIKQA